MGSVEDLRVHVLALDRDDFEALVVSECKGQAGEQITEVLAGDLELATRWRTALRRMVKRNQRGLERDTIPGDRRDAVLVFLTHIEGRLAEVERIVEMLRLDHETTDLREIVAAVLEDCDPIDLELTDRQWDLIDQIVGMGED